MLPILFLFSYRLQVSPSFHAAILTMPDFGFEAGGSYNFSIMFPQYSLPYMSILLLSTKYERSIIASLPTPVPNPCSMSLAATNFTIINSSTIYGIILTKGVYIPTILLCNTSVSGKFSVSLQYLNPSSCLDYRQQPSLILRPIVAAASLVLSVYWVVSSALSRRKFTKLVIFLSVIYTSYLALETVGYATLKQQAKSDDITPLDIIYEVSEVVLATAFTTFVLLASGGWGLISSSLTIKRFLFALVPSAVFFSIAFLISNVTDYSVILALLELVCMFIMIYILYNSTNKAQRALFAHMRIIRDAGVDPLSTPVFIAHKLYISFLFLSCGCVVAYTVLLAATGIAFDSYWINEMVGDLAIIALFVGLAFLYRPRGRGIDEFFTEEEIEQGGRQSVKMEDLDMKAEDFSGGEKWHAGMKLPPRPILVEGMETPLIPSPSKYK